ncbi:Sodium/hydrogen exchanger family-domain-containing protein [Dactylonectria macrodidyma]|uniref:Sodium/hydrogen exchanger family-domain-containing protein n=1 Tax=Dactylonectria macrodidyma TaxID=307937 RepID=A0A9P9J0H7_9HYPO|nr:Sodium/hydrogen exchanger family-domain-containing protein [Dactylonectria macrodidyma]
MAWAHLDVTKPHLVYIILGGFTSLFMLCSSVIKERMYIGEATVATLVGVIFGPHAANLINPNEWGSTDIITVEFSRIVLVVQCFAVGVELPKFYMERHWRSVVYLLIPVMTFGWLIVSLFIWWMVEPLSWLESLVVAACVTATDPVLASSVVGKGKFAKRVPKHLRDLLSAESGCNDGMAFPFIYLSLYLIQYNRNAEDVSFHFVVYVILYECIFGAIYGFMVGYIARHSIKFAEKRDLIDRESFLVFYFVIALFCAGSGSILGLDDLLVGFAAGVGFSNDGWFGEKTEESHVSNVIDLLLNLAYFVYFGTIIPWEQFNNNVLGLQAWRLVVIAVFVIFFRRIPIMMALKPLIPDIKTWREALFAGHFGPIGVGAIFVAMLARAELEHHEPVPMAELPDSTVEHYTLIYLVWPITAFLVVTSILVHGSSIAVFTLGKRINTLTLTMSYTAAPEDGPSWMNRLPRITSQSRSQARMSETSFEEYKNPAYPPGTLLRPQRDDDDKASGSRPSSIMARKRKSKKWDSGIGPGGPVHQSAIFPQRQAATDITPSAEISEKEVSPSRDNTDSTLAPQDSFKSKDPEKVEDESEDTPSGSSGRVTPRRIEVYDEGDNMIFETEDGEVIDVQPVPRPSREELPPPTTANMPRADAEKFWSIGGFRRKMSEVYSGEMEKRKDKSKSDRKHEPARAYQFGNTIIVEDEDGEVVKTYELPTHKNENGEGVSGGSDLLGTSLKYMGLGSLARPVAEKAPEVIAEEAEASGTAPVRPSRAARRQSVAQEQAVDDRNIRFTIGGVNQRMTKEDFIREVQKLNAKTRKEVVDQSTASMTVKRIATQEPPAAHSPTSKITKEPETAWVGRSIQRPTTGRSSESISPTRSPKAKASEEPAETAVERKRRLAALAGRAGGEVGGETPAERKRREAALGMGEESDDDSDDEGDERVPPTRRGITFAESTRPGKASKGKATR